MFYTIKKGDQFAVVGRMDYVNHVQNKVTKEINIKGEVFNDKTPSENPDWLGEGTMWSNQDKAIKYDEDSPKSTAKHHVWDVDMDELNSVMSGGKAKGKISIDKKIKKSVDLLKNGTKLTEKVYNKVFTTDYNKPSRNIIETATYVKSVDVNLDTKTYKEIYSNFTIRVGTVKELDRIRDSLSDITKRNIDFGESYIRELKKDDEN